ncbi:unnamed protein product [Candidula unifasciata]|uniref:TIR domain-containing protein n=1 Tax=Candidula unifasciata TaxID=100452 RepID=A0A8S3ZY32_9EUPU|nr:unnamed protein product [Candidula unifasciata]
MVQPKWELKKNLISLQQGNTEHKFQQIRNGNETSQLRQESYSEVLQPGPCSVLYCTMETIVNCTGMSLVNVSPNWFPHNTTILLLDKNSIETVDNRSFSFLTRLRVLDLSNNNIRHIQENAFKELINLEILNLEYNHLSERSFPPGIFDPLRQVNSLLVKKNKLKYGQPGNLFRKLDNLTFLTVDAVGEIFSLDKMFTHLTKLVLTGNVKVFDHSSFRNVPHTRELVINDLNSISNFTDTALEPLQNLDILRVNRVYIGIEKSLQILKPLTGTNMTSISFSRVYVNPHDKALSIYDNQGILNAEKTQYLLHICVEHFSLTESNVYVIQMNTFTSDVFKTCLRSLDLSSNRLLGSRYAFSIFLYFYNIEIINLENDHAGCYVKDSLSTNSRQQDVSFSSFTTQTASCYSYESTESATASSKTKVDEALIAHMLRHRDSFEEILSEENMRYPQIPFDDDINSQCPSAILPEENNLLGYLRLYMSKSVTYFKGKGLISEGTLNVNTIFVGGSGLRYIDIRDCGMKDFVGNIIGFNRLQIILLSGNDVSNLSETFFDGMCHITELDLSNSHLDVNFMSNQSARLFQKLLDLRRVDLSYNLLNHFKTGTFESNKQIEHIDLSRNRFRNVPFNLGHTPKLRTLDLRENSLTTLESHEIDHIDSLATHSVGFKLLIAGNIFSCGCNNLRFLIWLQTTSVNLDDGGQFTCLSDDGQLSYITDDIDTLWRKCWGGTFLSLSLILLCCIAVGFLALFCVWKNKTFIRSKILQIVTGYKLKTPDDYPTGVYIGYSENDYNFPCFVLRKFIEKELNLTTYVYNRDNDPRSDRASSIVDAINGCWRIILVATDNFLREDEWAMFTTRTAIYGLSPANPARVVVLVHEDSQYSLPPEVLSSVPEENILVLSSWTISGDLHRKLRTCLNEL